MLINQCHAPFFSQILVSFGFFSFFFLFSFYYFSFLLSHFLLTFWDVLFFFKRMIWRIFLYVFLLCDLCYLRFVYSLFPPMVELFICVLEKAKWIFVLLGLFWEKKRRKIKYKLQNHAKNFNRLSLWSERTGDRNEWKRSFDVHFLVKEIKD